MDAINQISYPETKMSDMKAAFFDVDGTLISHTKNIVPQSTKDAITKLQEKGIKCIIATGRPMVMLRILPVKEMVFDGYITLNGQICYDKHGQVIHDTPLTGEAKEKILTLFQKKKIPVALFEKKKIYINFINQTVIQAQKDINTGLPPIGDYTGEEIYLAVAYVPVEEEQEFKEELSMCRITRWSSSAVDVVSSDGDKLKGIQKFLEYEGISQEEMIAFGDGENDISMIKYARIGVAMGNGDEKAKAIADYVTDSVDEDGIMKACEYYGLLNR